MKQKLASVLVMGALVACGGETNDGAEEFATAESELTECRAVTRTTVQPASCSRRCRSMSRAYCRSSVRCC